MSFAIKGHSGAKVELRGDLVFKTVDTDKEWQRLLLNIDKQRGASFIYPSFHAPKIISLDHDKRQVAMEYAKGYDMFSLITDFRFDHQDHAVEMILDYFKFILTQSKPLDCMRGVMADKIVDSSKIIAGNPACLSSKSELVNIVADLFDSLEEPFKILVGPNHGDFTMGNLVYNPDTCRFHWFDFLNAFYASPLLDVAKMQQEFDYGWTAMMADGLDSIQVSLFRAKMGDFFEKKIHKMVDDLGMKKARVFMSQMNDLRLLQYETRESVAEIIVSTMMVRAEEMR